MKGDKEGGRGSIIFLCPIKKNINKDNLGLLLLCVSSGAQGPILESGGIDIIHGGSNWTWKAVSCFLCLHSRSKFQ